MVGCLGGCVTVVWLLVCVNVLRVETESCGQVFVWECDCCMAACMCVCLCLGWRLSVVVGCLCGSVTAVWLHVCVYVCV